MSAAPRDPVAAPTGPLSGPIAAEPLEPRVLLSAAAVPDVLTFDLVCNAFQLQSSTGGQQIVADGMEGYAQGGSPMLPGRMLRIALPPQADLDTVALSVLGDTAHAVPGRYDLAPAPLAATDGPDGPIFAEMDAAQIVDGRDQSIYASSAIYDAEVCTLVSAQQMRQWKFAEVWYSPFTYSPLSGGLAMAGEVTIQVSYALDESAGALEPDAGSADRAAELVYNFDQAAPWYADAKAPPTASNPTASYVIITTSTIQTNSAQLATFVAHKQSMGYSVQVVTEGTWGGGTGNTAAQNIRSWLASNYLSLGIQYVLLIGDPHPTTGTLAMKRMCPDTAHSYDSPTDYYYADLTSNWDADGDGFYGEWSQDLTSRPVHEVLVGRIPVYGTAYSTLDTILTKTRNYELQTNVAWRKNILLPMAISNYYYEDYHSDYERCDGHELGDAIRTNLATPWGYGSYRLYEQAGRLPVTATAEAAISSTNVRNTWSANQYGIVDWWGHGNSIGAYRKYWVSDDGDNVPESAEMSWPTLFTSSDVTVLNDNYPSFVVQVSCQNGLPEEPTSLGYSLLKQGAIGTLSASRDSWYAVAAWNASFGPSYGDNASFAYFTTKRIVENLNTETTAAALQYCRETFGSAWGFPSWMNATVFNLYGDPSIKLSATPPDLLATALDVVTDTLPSDPYSVVNFTVANQGIGAAGTFDVQFYLSDDATIDPATDTLLTLSTSDPKRDPAEPEAYHVSGLAASATLSDSVKLDVPWSDPILTDNAYYIGAFVDADTNLIESNETNNRSRGLTLDEDDVAYAVLAAITPVSPDPRSTAVLSAQITFTRPVAGVNASDFLLSRDYGSNLLGGGESVTSGDGIHWTLSTLTTLTDEAGHYGLTLPSTGSGIADLLGTPLSGTAIENWCMDTITDMGSSSDIRLVMKNANTLDVVFGGSSSALSYSLNCGLLPAVLYVNGLDGNDRITVDFSNGAPMASGGALSVDGGPGTNDVLKIKGSTSANAVSLGPTTMVVDGSTATYANIEGFEFDGGGSAADSLSVDATVTLVGQTTHRFSTLSLGTGSVVKVPDLAAAAMLDVNTLLIAGGSTPTAMLNLNDNSLIVGTALGCSQVCQWVKSGFAGGAWTGMGICSTTAGPNRMMAIGVVDNALVNFGTWRGVSGLSGTELLVGYTYYADVDLNGSVNSDDLSSFADSYGKFPGTAKWVDADTDFDGDVDSDDLSAFADNYGLTLS